MFFHTLTGALKVAIGEPPAASPYNSGYGFTNLERMYVIPWDAAAPLPADTVYWGGFARTSRGALYVVEATPSAVQKSLSVPARTVNGIAIVSSAAPGTGATFTAPWGMCSSVGQLHIDATFGLGFGDLGAGVVSIVAGISGATPTFTRATAAWTNLSDGTIGLVASGNPRSTYSPTGTYLGYLAEGARTNVCQRGEDFTAVWTDVGTPTVAAGTTIGALTLSTLGDDSAAALEGKIQTVTFTGDAVKAISLYVKQGTSTSTAIRVRDTSAPADRLLAVVTWSGTVPVVTMTTGTDVTGTPQQQGTSGVYRLSFVTTAVTAANTNSLEIYPATDAALAVTGTGTIQVGGVQAEDAVFPSSLIRTPASATVTRNADVLTYATTTWLSETAGSIFVQSASFTDATTTTSTLVEIDDGTGNNRHTLSRASGAANQATVVGAAVQANPSGGSWAVNTFGKSIYAYAVNDFIGAFNGATFGADTSGTLPTGLTVARVGIFTGVAGPNFGPISRVGYWNTRLPNSTLTGLTA